MGGDVGGVHLVRVLGQRACAAHSSGSGTSATGYMYIWPGMSCWTGSESRKSTKARAPSGLAAPAMTPAYSTCRKQVSSSAPVRGSASSSGTSAAGEEE